MVELMPEAEDEILSTYPVADGSAMIWSALRSHESLPAFSHPSDPSQLTASLVRALRAEIRKLLCTKDKEYARERSLLDKTTLPAISLLTGFIVGKFGVPAAAASALAATLLLVPIKIGVRTWCASLAENESAMSNDEKQVISELSGNS